MLCREWKPIVRGTCMRQRGRMANEHADGTPPGTPGRCALGAMESAVRRAPVGRRPTLLIFHHHARNSSSRPSSRRPAEGRAARRPRPLAGPRRRPGRRPGRGGRGCPGGVAGQLDVAISHCARSTPTATAPSRSTVDRPREGRHRFDLLGHRPSRPRRPRRSLPAALRSSLRSVRRVARRVRSSWPPAPTS